MTRQGTILYVCTAAHKGIAKTAVSHAMLHEDYGIEGDAHAGLGRRQVSLLSATDIDAMRACGVDLQPGAFGENLVVTGLTLDDLGIGTILQIGPARLEITQIGKVCHHHCAIYDRIGDCIMPRAGLFARVLTGGEIAPGMPITITTLVARDATCAAG